MENPIKLSDFVFRWIYPLWLRQSLFARLRPWSARGCFRRRRGYLCEFAPFRLTGLLNTDFSHQQIARLGFYDLQLSSALARLARSGGLLVDVGANIGYFSCLWTALNSQNTAYAFEPSPRNISLLHRNVEEQRFRERIKIYEIALGKEKGMVEFDPGPAEQTGWGGIAAKGDSTILVSVDTLDDLILPNTAITVLKIDTEGADAWVLEGAASLLRQKRVAHIFCERNVTRMNLLGIADGTIERFLERHGYAVEYLPGRNREQIHAYIERPLTQG